MISERPAEPSARLLARREDFPDLPKDEVAAADEREMLVRFLDYQRAVLARKADGITDEQARIAACPPSNLTMLGLVRHLAEVERGWAHESFLGVDLEPLYVTPDRPSGDWVAPADATLADALATWWAEVDAADRVYTGASLDDVSVRGWEEYRYSVRWILIHLVEEYARHCGQADLIREAIDGAVGD
jgi:hypothetical protein